MDSIINFANDKEIANEIIYFNDGRMASKNESKTYAIIKTIFVGFLIILICGSVLFKEFLFSGESIPVWICVFIVVSYLMKNGGHERVECPSQLQFFDTYMIFYVPKYHYKKGKERMDLHKIYYKDVTICKFRANIQKMVICGMMDVSYYEYDKEKRLNKKPTFQKHCNGIIKFYTIFDSEHNFIDIIEKNSPLKIEIENS